MADDGMEVVEQQYGLAGVDDDARTIYLVGDFGHNVVEHLATALDHLVRLGLGDILVRITSPGGYASTGLMLYDLMRSCPVRVNTEAMGVVASTAVAAYLGGERRLAYEHSTVMVHGTRAEGSGSRALLRVELEGMQWYDDRLADLLGERTAFARHYWVAMLEDGRNHELRGGEELLEHGLATDLVQQ